MLVRRRPRGRGARCAASATRAARRTWAGSTTTGSASTTGSPTLQAALGVAQLERLDELLADRAAAAALYAERLAALDYGAPAGEGDPDGLVLPCADEGEERRSWFVYAVRLPTAADRDAVFADLAQRGVEAKAYMPCIHLMSHMRERFGYREGQFPVAEDASARLLALPFFPQIDEGQVDRVCEALAEALLGDWT